MRGIRNEDSNILVIDATTNTASEGFRFQKTMFEVRLVKAGVHLNLNEVLRGLKKG